VSAPKTLIVGISGASGTAYGIRFVERALRMGHLVHLIVTNSGWRVMQEECGIAGSGAGAPLSVWLRAATKDDLSRATLHNNRDIAALPASGTFRAHAMVIIPASMKTVAGLACGYSEDLLLRAADVFIKERRPLVVVPRETPLSVIHLRNMTTLAEAGVHVVPAMPGFYAEPKSVDDIIDFMAMKVFDVLGIEHGIPQAWAGPRHERA